jgi:type IV pilus assembly protein PilA
MAFFMVKWAVASIPALLILGVLAGVFWAVVLGSFASLGRVSHRDGETAALRAIQTLNTAQVQYNSQFGRFAQSLAELGPPASGTANASAADLISGDLATGEKQGYRFTLTGTPRSYTITAVPTAFGSTGSRTFFSDESLVIRENYGQEPANARSAEVGSGSPR